MAGLAGLKEKLKKVDLKGLKEKAMSLVVGPQDIIGIDIGSHAVKVAAIKKVKDKLTLHSWGYLPLDPKPEATADERKQQTINLLKAFLIQKNVQIKNVATSISGNAVIVRYVKFPLLTKNEFKATLATEAEPFIPFDINEVQLGFHILGELVEEGQKKMETVLVAAKKEAVQMRVEVLQSLGLKPTIIDVDSFALENVYERMAEAGTGGGATLLLNVGHSVTNLSIIEEGVTRVVRDILISGNTFTRAIMKSLQCEFPKAEEAKKAFGILVDPEEKEKALQAGQREALGVSQAVTTVLKDMVGELHRSVDFYLSQGPERSIGRIVLSGGSAGMKNMARHLAAELKVPVSVLDPFACLSELPADIPKEIAPGLGVAVGLALRSNRDWE
ncbi:MAG: type IV pilus assembly protein PilM [Elusimicrobiota bacterium]